MFTPWVSRLLNAHSHQPKTPSSPPRSRAMPYNKPTPSLILRNPPRRRRRSIPPLIPNLLLILHRYPLPSSSSSSTTATDTDRAAAS